MAFDRTKLSRRENDILDLAIEGLTDLQIAARLDLRVGTVNSYWVRIRGKLGNLTRTELVAGALRQASSLEVARLRAKAEGLAAVVERNEQDATAVRDAWRAHAILDCLLYATFAVDGEGCIVYANQALEKLFGYPAGELIGESFQILLRPRDGVLERPALETYLADPKPMRIGLDRVLYGRRKDGSLIRVILAINGRRTPHGVIATCVVRNFIAEVAQSRRSIQASVPWDETAQA